MVQEPAALALPGNTAEMQILRAWPNGLNKNLRFNKIPKKFMCMLLGKMETV